MRKYVDLSQILQMLAACCLLMLSASTGGGQVNTTPPGTGMGDSDAPNSPLIIKSREHKQQKELMKMYLANMRKDAAEMAKLAESIQEDLSKTTENELPFRVVSNAEKVEKLAKKIKNTAKGF